MRHRSEGMRQSNTLPGARRPPYRKASALRSDGTMAETFSSLFDAYYYQTSCGSPYQRNDHWLGIFGALADRIMTEIGPRSVMDAGCALGLLVEQLRARGVDAEGIDISEYAIAHAHEQVRPYVRLGSITEPLGRRYDLVVCIEVLEHMPRADAEAAIANMCAWSDDILFSSSPYDHKETTHINVHPPEYWAERFALHGFFRDVDFDASFITPWAVRFRRCSEPIHRIVRNYERRFWELWDANRQLRELTIDQRNQLAQAIAVREETERFAEESRAYALRLETEIAGKNEHIRHLEQLVHRLENGGVMRLLRLLTGRRQK
ncbi:methyltransferase domain-containing protein [Roseiflexus sp.]|uniref:class I SAM-dependent methyltransferase n=1 Tax=Roseiflexus sp. TaxID=2562120 RepID=UPI00398BA693